MNQTPKELISKAARKAFREFCVSHLVLRQIDDAFDSEDFKPSKLEPQGVGGERRSLVEQYYANIDFTDEASVLRLLRVYEEAIIQGREGIPDDLHLRMQRDGFEFQGGKFVRDQGDFSSPLFGVLEKNSGKTGGDLQMQLTRLRAADSDPALVIGTGKELVESVCKIIMDARGISSEKRDLPVLVKTTFKAMSISADSIEENAKGAETIRRTLNNLAQVAQGLAELRNLYGTGHGRSRQTGGVKPRHARLAAGAAMTLAAFLLETHDERPPQNKE